MKQAIVLRRRRVEQQRLARRRNLSLAAASMVLHVLVFLLIPGLAVKAELPVELLVELVRPASAAQRSQAPRTFPDTSPSSVAATPVPAEPAPTPAPQEPVQAAAVPAGDGTDAPVPAPVPAEQPPVQVPRQQASEVATVTPAPPVVAAAESPQQVPKPVEDEPVQPTPATVEDAPVNPPADNPASEPEPEQQPVPEVAEDTLQPQPEPQPEPAPVPETAPPVHEPEDGASAATAEPVEASQADPAQPSAGTDETAPEEGPPAPPPGPTEHELNLLGEYGDGARLRIRSQARNTEDNVEGTVTFEFEVARDGHLIDVRLLKSSGYTSVDNDAIEATRAAFNERVEKKPFPADITVDSWVFVMSMKYPLW